MSPRVAVIGPHRRRSGTGPFVAEFFRRAGCRVEGWDRDRARRFLTRGEGNGEVDAVAICSPAETHFDYLTAAVAGGLHTFCEKPVVWPSDGTPAALDGLIAGLETVLRGAGRAGLVVHENTQWVYTLDDFRRIAGEIPKDEVRHFRCELSPSESSAAGMIMECAAHANSLLAALGGGEAGAIRARYGAPDGGRSASLELDFCCRGAAGRTIDVEYRFARQSGQPRHAAYAVNHRRVERRVDLQGYKLSLRFDGRDYPIRDPLESSVGDFLALVANGAAAGRAATMLATIRLSSQLLKACCEHRSAEHA